MGRLHLAGDLVSGDLMNSLQGQLLVATPQLTDGNFFRSVVLMIQHDEDGALGVVLNRPTSTTIQQLWEMLGEPPCTAQGVLHWGGPVGERVMAVHTVASLTELTVMPGIFVAMHKEHLTELVQQNEPPYRMFSGYAGWGPGQLEGELQGGGWLLTPATPSLVFGDTGEIWQRVIALIGQDILRPAVGTHLPPDPSLN